MSAGTNRSTMRFVPSSRRSRAPRLTSPFMSWKMAAKSAPRSGYAKVRRAPHATPADARLWMRCQSLIYRPADVQAPAMHKPSDEQFFEDDTRQKPNIQFLKQHFYREGRLTEEQ